MNNKLLDDAREAGFEYSEAGKIWIANNTDLARFAELQQPQALLSQGEPVAYMFVNEDGECEEISHKSFYKEPNRYMLDIGFIPLYTAQPSTESLQYEVSAKIGKLQEDKAELIEYAENIRGALDAIMIFGADIDKAKEFSKMALAIPQPQCME